MKGYGRLGMGADSDLLGKTCADMATGGKIDSKEADPRPKRCKAEGGRYLAKAHSQPCSVGQRRSDSHRLSAMSQGKAVVMLVFDLSSGHKRVKKIFSAEHAVRRVGPDVGVKWRRTVSKEERWSGTGRMQTLSHGHVGVSTMSSVVSSQPVFAGRIAVSVDPQSRGPSQEGFSDTVAMLGDRTKATGSLH